MDSTTQRFGKRDGLFLAAITGLGLIVRFWNFGRLGLTHFDEGIYAVSGLWATSPGSHEPFWVGIVPYAPPGFVILVGVLYAILGASDLAAIAVAQLAGVATILAVAWLGGRTFGRSAGLVAAALVAVAGPHVAFSRLALTDSLFLLVWVVALGLGQRFLERPGPERAIALGLGVGLLQQCKYHGWLVGLIVAIGAAIGLLPNRTRPPDRGGRWAAFRWGLVAAGIAATVVFPWYDFVDHHGGYGRLLAHQRSYLNGWDHWGPNLVTQWRQSHALAGDIQWAILGWIAALAISVVGPRDTERNYPVGVRVSGGLILAVVAVVMPESTWCFGLLVLPIGVRSGSAARLVLGVAWLVLAALTPFYHPYARLWLQLETLGGIAAASLLARGFVPPGQNEPNLAASALDPGRQNEPKTGRAAILPATAAQIQNEPNEPLSGRPAADRANLQNEPNARPSLPRSPLAAWFQNEPNATRRRSLTVAMSLCLVLFAVHLTLVRPVSRLPDHLAPTDAIRTAVDELAGEIPREVPSVVTLVRPGVLFYLRGRVAAAAQPDLATFARSAGPNRWGLLDGGLAGSTGADGGLPPEVAEHWEVVAVRPTTLSLPALLDLDPGATDGTRSRVVPIWLLRSRPPGARP